MPVLHEAAERCAAVEDLAAATFQFARGDLDGLASGTYPDVASLLAFFPEEQRATAARVDAWLAESGYRAACRVYLAHGWDIQYQGPRKIKGLPLVQIEYSERHSEPLRARVKGAATARLLPYFAEQPAHVQADFVRRAYRCQGDKCGWCKNRKGLGLAVLEYQGERLVLCWHVHADLSGLSEGDVALLQDYVRWHERLA